ncbi:MAG: deoxyribonuclease IV [Chloroflexi bacterium]|nr:deoxyribonuclease IV [Chloroflexota bacterium]MCY3588564.1 deoxyribonuclease IV [Chloroflexota bacterium]MCY3685608.1 deoxyribonuclease IV [Chloroflexota bacterium]MDE2708510.1 deoxyribonuclease IV [Chloroflexota bacterium]
MARTPSLGAHVSSAGGIDKAVERAVEVGAESFQIFGAAPQMWRRKHHPDEDAESYRAKFKQARLKSSFIHAVYLINLASPDDELLRKSTDTLTAELDLAARIGADGVIFHVGSHMGSGFDHALPRIAASMTEALDRTPDDALLLIENNAGAGRSVGSVFSEISAIMNAVDNPRVRICLDTCHAHAAGYNVATIAGLKETVDEFQRELGADNLAAIHANDSKTELGSGKDRHENIGQGSIGIKAFRRMVRNRLLRKAAWLLEVPGYEGGGPGKADVDMLKALRDDSDVPEVPQPAE